MSFTQDECQQKIEKLKLWQEKQKQILYDKQMEEKRLLCDTQQSNYDSFINNSINNSNCDKINNENTGIKKNKIIVKKTFLRRGEGLKNRFGVDPDRFMLKNLPKYKYSNKIKDFNKKLCLNNKSTSNSLHKSEEGALSVERKEVSTTVVSVNPRLKDSIESNIYKNQSTGASKSVQSKTKVTLLEEGSDEEVQTWAKVLDPKHLNPITISQFKGHSLSEVSQNENDQLNLFELLERKVNDSSYSFNSSDIIELLKSKNFYPDKQVFNSEISNEPLLSTQEVLDNKLQTTLEPSPTEIEDLKSKDDSDTESCDSSFHVRFSDNVVVNEIHSDSESDYENINDTLKPLNANITSTPIQVHKSLESEINTDENFEKFIEQIVGLKQKEIQEKSELLDIRLKELEHEISLFQKQNQILTKMKQEHELEKIDMESRLKQSKKILDDEKIRIEIYLNDEKSKLKEEKLKIEKKLSQPNKRDREEIFRLQDQVIELKEEMKAKETKHSSAQSRLRAQIRNLEKNLREKELEIENFKKENKKLEFENSRLRRQATSKMLNEINKNISKLAIANQSPPSSNSKQDDEDKSKKSSIAQTKQKLKSVKTKRQTVKSSSSSSSSVSSKSQSSSSEVEDECDAHLTDRNTNISDSSARELGKSESCTQSEISDTLKSLKREISNPDGSKDIWYPNGNIKKISADGLNIKMLYYNKDIKETNINEGVVRYYYAETNTWHTQYLDGLEILEFPNGQTEHRYKDGKVAVHFENGSIKIKDPNDPEIAEEWRYADGTIAKIKINGEKNILLPNGQKEIHTTDHKRREYPDGTIKIVYPDGSQETRYSNGRVRLKDKEGKLVMDSVS